jgi:hypothetical protein
MRFLKYLLFLTLFLFLTALTQIGGIVLLINLVVFQTILKQNKYTNIWSKLLTFSVLYLITTFVIVPPIAKQYGRVPMPMFLKNHIRPTNVWTCILNRNYVRPEMKESVENVAKKMADRYAGTEIWYLDACLPFGNGFPLLPHLSHNDGRKLDVSFFYKKNNFENFCNEKPSNSGYGVFEKPRQNEENKPEECLKQGFWQYDFPKYFTFGADIERYKFDDIRTKTMIEYFCNENMVEKLFLEPHLQFRMDLHHNKLRFHGCQAVRHDDHLHIQTKNRY